MKAAGDQAKTACENMQLGMVLEAGVEGATHAVLQRILERTRQIWIEEEARRPENEEDKDKDKDKASGGERLTMKT